MITYRRDVHAASSREAFGLVALGPAFVAAALAAFAGEHFTAAAGIATLVPKWMPARLFIAYFVGVAHLAAASSFVARRYVRWSSLCLAVMFGLFVLLMDLPGAADASRGSNGLESGGAPDHVCVGCVGAVRHRDERMPPGVGEVLTTIDQDLDRVRPDLLRHRALHPSRLFAGSADYRTSPRPGFRCRWPSRMRRGRSSSRSGSRCSPRSTPPPERRERGLLMTVLTAVLYVPQFFLARDAAAHVTAINFIFDTLLFAGMMFVISRAMSDVAPVRARKGWPQRPPARSRPRSEASRSVSRAGHRPAVVLR